MNKSSIREIMKNKRDIMSKKDNYNLSNQVINKILESKFYKDSENIFTFVSTGSEIFTHNFIKHSIAISKKIYIPYINYKNKAMHATQLKNFSDLETGFYGILSLPKTKLEIIEPGELDLVLVPGLAFGKNFHRVGYGGGYYDRYLSKLYSKTKILGICFNFQVVEHVDNEVFDIPVDKIITDKLICERRYDYE